MRSKKKNKRGGSSRASALARHLESEHPEGHNSQQIQAVNRDYCLHCKTGLSNIPFSSSLGLGEKRHRCRKCQHYVCAKCSSNKDGKISNNSHINRYCSSCYPSYREENEQKKLNNAQKEENKKARIALAQKNFGYELLETRLAEAKKFKNDKVVSNLHKFSKKCNKISKNQNKNGVDYYLEEIKKLDGLFIKEGVSVQFIQKFAEIFESLECKERGLFIIKNYLVRDVLKLGINVTNQEFIEQIENRGIDFVHILGDPSIVESYNYINQKVKKGEFKWKYNPIPMKKYYGAKRYKSKKMKK